MNYIWTLDRGVLCTYFYMYFMVVTYVYQTIHYLKGLVYGV